VPPLLPNFKTSQLPNFLLLKGYGVLGNQEAGKIGEKKFD